MTGGDQTAATPLVLLHGWTGDETVMWIFARNLHENAWIFAPRGPIHSQGGGYGWLPRENGWPPLADFAPAAEALITEIRHLTADVHAPQGPFDLMGFSQGAAMAYAVAALYPQQVRRVVALAGFLPQDDPKPGRYSALRGKQFYIAHGTQDDTVPIEMAQEAVRFLQPLGVQVTYCESDVGHKLSASCLRGLEVFLKK